MNELTADEKELLNYIKRQTKPVTRSTVANSNVLDLDCFVAKNHEGRKRALRDIIGQLNEKLEYSQVLSSSKGISYSENPDEIHRDASWLRAMALSLIDRAAKQDRVGFNIEHKQKEIVA